VSVIVSFPFLSFFALILICADPDLIQIDDDTVNDQQEFCVPKNAVNDNS